MRKSILIYKRRSKVLLLGTKSKPYKVRINEECSDTWYGTNEGWLVTNLYLGNKDIVANILRSRYPEIAPDEIDRFIETVKKDHPLDHGSFNWKEIPLYATANSYCEINMDIYKYPIKLTLKQEQSLLDIITDEQYDKKGRIIRWFKQYRQEYGIDTRLKRDQEIQDEALADVFCLAHGLELDNLDGLLCSKSSKKNNGANGCLVLALVLMGTFGLLLLGNESESWLVGVLCAVPFLLMVGYIAKFLGIK